MLLYKFTGLIAAVFFSFGVTLALDIKIDGGDTASQEVVKNSQAYRRLAALKTADGALFWMRRLNRDAQVNLQSLGYYEALVESLLNQNKDKVLVNIKLGSPVTISKVTIGLPAEAKKEIKFPLAIGDQIDHNLYEQGKQRLHGWLLAHGYLQAQLQTHTVKINKKEKTAVIQLEWESGPQYKFGEVIFEDNRLSPHFLKRYIPFKKGDDFNESLLQKFSDQLRNSGYFSSVDIIPLIDQAIDLQVPLQVRLQPLKRTVYELGLSLGTDQGAGIEADVKRRRSNPKGHNWQVHSELTTQRFLLGTRYNLPSASQLDKITRVDLSYIDETTDTSERQTIKSTLSRQKLYHNWQRVDSLALLSEKFIIADTPERSSLLIISTDLSRTKALNTINPDKGWRSHVNVSASSDVLGSATDFIRTEFDYKRIGSINDKTRWLIRSRFGALWVDDFKQLPSSLRFFAGGDRSVRGFDFEELGPTDAENNVLGGQYVATGSLELDYLIKPSWRLAAFVDAGNAFGTGTEAVEYSAGAGIRWLSPIGPVRLDFANALSEVDKPWRMHFSIGPDL